MNFCPMRVLAALLVSSIAACGRPVQSKLDEAMLSTESGLQAAIGHGYFSEYGRLTSLPCVASPMAKIRGMITGKTTVNRNLSAEDLLNKISGQAGIGYPIYPGVEAGANVQFATNFAKTDMSINHVVSSEVSYSDSISDLVDPSPFLLELQRNAQKFGLNSSETQELILRNCGDEYVSAIYSGASIVMVVQVNFGSQESYMLLHAELSLELLDGIAQIKAGAGIAKNQFAESLSVSIGVKQIGGDPGSLVGIFPEGLPNCAPDRSDPTSTSWLEPCNAALRTLHDYFSGTDRNLNGLGVRSFPDQLRDADALVPLTIETRPYKFAFYRPQKPNDIAERPRKYLDRLALVNEWRAAVQSLIESAGTKSERFLKILQEELTTANAFKTALNGAVQSCWENLSKCDGSDQKIAELIRRYPLDFRLLRYGDAISDASSWCRRLGVARFGSFPNSTLTFDEEAVVVQLYERAGIVIPGRDDKLEDSCIRMNQVLNAKRRLNLSKQFGSSIKSVMPLDSLSNTEVLELAYQNLSEFPRFYNMPKLAMLNLAYNHGIKMTDEDKAAMSRLPASIRCLDLTDSGQRSVSLVRSFPGETLILGETMANESLEELVQLGKSLDHPITVIVDNGNEGNYENLTILISSRPVTCTDLHSID